MNKHKCNLLSPFTVVCIYVSRAEHSILDKELGLIAGKMNFPCILISYSSLFSSGAKCGFPNLYWDVHYCQNCPGLVRDVSFHGYSFPAISRRLNLTSDSVLQNHLTIFPLALLHCSLSLKCKSCVVDVTAGPGYHISKCLLHFNYLWLSVNVSS